MRSFLLDLVGFVINVVFTIGAVVVFADFDLIVDEVFTIGFDVVDVTFNGINFFGTIAPGVRVLFGIVVVLFGVVGIVGVDFGIDFVATMVDFVEFAVEIELLTRRDVRVVVLGVDVFNVEVDATAIFVGIGGAVDVTVTFFCAL